MIFFSVIIYPLVIYLVILRCSVYKMLCLNYEVVFYISSYILHIFYKLTIITIKIKN